MATSGIGKRRAAAQDEGTRAYRERRLEIIEAAAQVFKSRGFRGAGIGEIARVLGTDRASLYYYIGSKAELFDEVVTDAVEANLAGAEAIRDSDAAPAVKVRTLVESLMASYETHYPFLYVFIQENLSHVDPERTDWANRMREVNRRYAAATEAIIQQGYDSGTLREAGPAWVVAYGLIGMVAWTNRWFDPVASPVDGATIGRTYAGLLLQGLSTGQEQDPD